MKLLPQKTIRKILAVLALATAIVFNAPIQAAEANYPKVPPSSPLHQLTEEYFSDDYQGDEDPLRTPDRKSRSVALVKLGWEFVKVHHATTGLRRFFLAIRMDETNASAYFGVAYVCSVQNDLDDAITFYREAMKYDPKFAPVYANLAKALLLKDKDSAEAPKLLDTAIQIDPNDPETYITYSRYYADRDDWNTAAEKMNQAIALGRQLDPGVIKDFKKHGIQLNQPPPAP